MIFENVLKEGINIACKAYFAVRSICLPLLVGSRVKRKKKTPAVENEPLLIQIPLGDTHFVQIFKEEKLNQLVHFFLEGNRNWHLMRRKACISGIPLTPTLTPSMRAGPENMEGRSPCRENNDSLPIQIPRCDKHFVQFKEEKLIQLGIFLFSGEK